MWCGTYVRALKGTIFKKILHKHDNNSAPTNYWSKRPWCIAGMFVTFALRFLTWSGFRKLDTL